MKSYKVIRSKYAVDIERSINNCVREGGYLVSFGWCPDILVGFYALMCIDLGGERVPDYIGGENA